MSECTEDVAQIVCWGCAEYNLGLARQLNMCCLVGLRQSRWKSWPEWIQGFGPRLANASESCRSITDWLIEVILVGDNICCSFLGYVHERKWGWPGWLKMGLKMRRCKPIWRIKSPWALRSISSRVVGVLWKNPLLQSSCFNVAY